MGKNIIQQARGRGGPTYRAPSFKYKGDIKHYRTDKETLNGKVLDFVKCRGHSAPLALISYEDGEYGLMLAPEGISVGQDIIMGNDADIIAGNTSALKNMPEGTLVHNLESKPGDGGKFCRASGAFAKVVSKTDDGVIVQMPSKKQKKFHNECKATIGVIAGGGRKEKPFLKAGKKFHYMKARNKLYPIVSGSSMNAVDHPFGNARSSRKSKAKPTPRNAPPGRKVGMVAAGRTGRRKK